MFIKFANSELKITEANVLTPENALSSPQITERFKKLAFEIKKVAPKSNEFLYFIARGIHAMEHAAIDPTTREYNPKIGHMAMDNGSGECVTCSIGLVKSASGSPISGLWCKSSTIEPWINQNGDAFPEHELLAEVTDPQDSNKTIRAYQTFVGKGLFTDHKSSEVENIRGIVLDAEYDHAAKGVDLLIALDKVNYPELARQVAAGYSAQVSMGTQVNYSLCSGCGNKAITENDYCSHVRNDKALTRAGQERIYEVNAGLNFIEISMVGNAADPRARIRTIVASAAKIRKEAQANLDSNGGSQENQLILESISRLEQQIGEISSVTAEPEVNPLNQDITTSQIVDKIAQLEQQIKEIGGTLMAQNKTKKAYFQGTVDPESDAKPFNAADKTYNQYWEDDIKQTGADQTNGTEGMHGGYGLGSDEEVHKMYQRATTEERKIARKALLDRVAYMQGTVEPESDTKPFNAADKSYNQYWEDDIKQTGADQTNGTEGTHGGYGMGSDDQVKKDLLRAKLKGKLKKSANPLKNKWIVLANDTEIVSVTAEEAYGEELNLASDDVEGLTNQEWFDSKNYGVNLIQAIKTFGREKVAAQIASAKVVTAQAAPAAPAPEAPIAEVAPMEELPMEEAPAEEMGAAEGIKAAAEQIESAKTEIDRLVEQLPASAALEGEEAAADLGAAGTELGEIAAEAPAAEALPAVASRVFKQLTKEALTSADAALVKAEAFATKYAAFGKDEEKEEDKEDKKEEDKKDEDKKDDKDTKAVEIKVEDKDEDGVDKKDVEVKEAAAQRRRKLAQELYNLTSGDMIDEAHPQGGNTTAVPQEGGKVETVKEQQEDDLAVVESVPTGELTARKVYRTRLVQAAISKFASEETSNAAKAATETHKKSEEAESKAADELDSKADKPVAKTQSSEADVKTAEVDSETKQYYSELAAPGDSEVSKFYSELTSDFDKKKSTAAVHNNGVKMKRAYAVAMRQASLGQIERSQDSLEAQVDRLLNLDDEGFKAFADVIENTKKVNNVKTASKQVRTAGAINVGVDSAEGKKTFKEELSDLWS